MIYYKSIGCTDVDSGIQGYLDLLKKQNSDGSFLVGAVTTLSHNGGEYPIGCFDESNIQYFREGMQTTYNMAAWIERNKDEILKGTADFNEMWKFSEAYGEHLLAAYNDENFFVDEIVAGFNKAFKSECKIPMFSEKYEMDLIFRLEELRRKRRENENENENAKPLVN
ncbi:MAG: hypothetical protein IJJ63_02805 [Bacilli bacterium]|nr:hypothetical protein [Bacilli bacterium]